MKRTLFLISMPLFAATAWAEDIDSRLDADADGQVYVYNLSGSVEVIGWSDNEVHVTGELGDDVEEFYFERDGDTIKIKVKVPDRSWGRKDVSSELIIRVPTGNSVEVDTVSADIDIEGVTGELDLEAVSGDITAEVAASDVQIEAVSGDIDLSGDGSAIDCDIENTSGDVTVDSVGGDIDITVVSGDIEVADGAFADADLETVNGEIEFVAALEDGGRLDIESVNGGVEVEFTNDVGGRFEIETFNGRIRNCFGPEAERTSRYAPGWELEFEHGSGNSRVSIATLNGSVSLCME